MAVAVGDGSVAVMAAGTAPARSAVREPPSRPAVVVGHETDHRFTSSCAPLPARSPPAPSSTNPGSSDQRHATGARHGADRGLRLRRRPPARRGGTVTVVNGDGVDHTVTADGRRVQRQGARRRVGDLPRPVAPRHVHVLLRHPPGDDRDARGGVNRLRRPGVLRSHPIPDHGGSRNHEQEAPRRPRRSRRRRSRRLRWWVERLAGRRAGSRPGRSGRRRRPSPAHPSPSRSPTRPPARS